MSGTHDDGRNSAVFAVGWLDELAESAGKRSRFQNLGGPAGFFLRRGTRRIKITVLRLIFPGKKNKKPAVTPALPITVSIDPGHASGQDVARLCAALTELSNHIGGQGGPGIKVYLSSTPPPAGFASRPCGCAGCHP